MIKGIHVNFYFSKGKALEVISCAENGDDNSLLEKHEQKIASLIIPLLGKKLDKKFVYFIVWEGSYLERGELKSQTELKIVQMDYSPTEFKKLHAKMLKDDLKVLQRPDKEEDYG